MKPTEPTTEVVELVPARIACYYRVMPLSCKNGQLRVAISDRADLDRLDELRLALGYTIEPVQWEEEAILESIKQYYGIGADTLERLSRTATDTVAVEEKEEDLADLSADSSIIKFVNQLILDAYRERATDIHIEPFEKDLRVRYRIDGMLYETSIPSQVKQWQEAIVSRIKIMANLNIAEKRVPQDGRIKVQVGDERLDLRVSILPVAHGESVDIRILQRSNVFLSLEQLGLSEQGLEVFNRVVRKPHGIVLLTGPTGSGKTTTLYACLDKMNSIHRKIITIEDPVEYQMRGICQMQVLPKIGFTFAAGLRSMLRHDPDVMMVGEIRDFETAELAIRAALTGHLVFSTLHTNDAAGAVTRLLDIGIETYLVASSVECVVAQRLVRLVCKGCSRRVKPDRWLCKELGLNAEEEDSFVGGEGCDACRGSGYFGRTAIGEIMVMNESIRELVSARAPAGTIRNRAIKQGMVTLRDDGLVKARAGFTSLEEVLRVTQSDEDLAGL